MGAGASPAVDSQKGVAKKRRRAVFLYGIMKKVKRAKSSHDPKRRRCFSVQPLEKCRAEFQAVMRIDFHDWDDGDEDDGDEEA